MKTSNIVCTQPQQQKMKKRCLAHYKKQQKNTVRTLNKIKTKNKNTY